MTQRVVLVTLATAGSLAASEQRNEAAQQPAATPPRPSARPLVTPASARRVLSVEERLGKLPPELRDRARTALAENDEGSAATPSQR